MKRDEEKLSKIGGGGGEERGGGEGSGKDFVNEGERLRAREDRENPASLTQPNNVVK